MFRTALIVLLVSFSVTASLAQEMPPPRRMPRTPVSREALAGPHDAIPASKELQGAATVVDGNNLRIGKIDLRLFGAVSPQLAASFGPQARAALDSLIGGQNISCRIRDRDRDGRLLAICANAGGNDLAFELLKRGLAVVARGSLVETEYAAPYASAEQVAQSQKLGLWSAVASAPQTKAETPPSPTEESKKEEKLRAEQAAQAKAAADAQAQAKAAAAATAQAQAKIEADVLAQQAQHVDEVAWDAGANIGFIERYQILISGLLMLATALCIASALESQRIRDRRDETKALAAALRGELMAARGVCFGRAKSITSDAEDRTAVWPRIRITLYQAYVGRLGLLGADLARQIASIYGQSSDYAALYNPAGGGLVEITKKQALESLLKRIDEVLPKLAEVERTGRISTSHSMRGASSESSLSYVILGLSSFFRALYSFYGAVRENILTSRNAAEPMALPSDPPVVTEYTAIIEADMERYQYTENVEPLDVSPHRKRKKEKGAA